MIPKEVFEQTLREFLGPIRPFLDDPTVSEIMINGKDQIFVERKGKLTLTEAKFSSDEALMTALRNIAQYVGKQISTERPILEGRLPDGSRIEAVLPPASPDGASVAIRRFFKDTLTMEKLINFGSMTPVAAQALKAFVEAKLNIMVAGGTGSGKTSMLNALSAYIPNDERVVVLEDNREVQLQRTHVVSLEARPPDAKGRGAVSIRDLFRASLRMRPDRLIVGEIRSGEALDIIQAMTSGHGGCMGTLHATYPRDTLTRLETMCMMSDIDMPLTAMRIQIASGMNLIVQVGRLRDGSRKVTHISEVLGFDVDSGKYLIEDVFVRNYRGMDEQGQLLSDFVPTGYLPECLPQLKEHGVDLPIPVYDVAQDRAEQRRLAST
jgi:pilus assembly protein CpaF